MQALARCGSEFLTLSVEELEDALRVLNSLQDNCGNDRAQCFAPMLDAASTRNPFNIIPTSPSRVHLQKSVQEKHSIAHLTSLLALSWEEMQSSVREYLDNVVSDAFGEASDK